MCSVCRVMSRIQQLQCMHPVDAALSREEFHRFVFSNKEYITGVITELQSLLQVKTLGKQRWKALQSTRISLSGGLHLSHEEYINNVRDTPSIPRSFCGAFSLGILCD